MKQGPQFAGGGPRQRRRAPARASAEHLFERIAARGEPLPRELGALLRALGCAGAPAGAAPPPGPSRFQLVSETRGRREAASARDAEAMEELIQLTSRLKRPLFASHTAPGDGPGIPFGPYRLLEKVALGGMAEIFRARRIGLEGFAKTVALKRILPHLSDNQEFVTMFVDEAKTVARLSHPNIVHIFDLGRIESSHYIAMEFVHGRDLRSIFKRCQERSTLIPEPLALWIASRVCAGLGYAHRKRDERGRPMRIVHRDVSPQNVLISFDGEVKLTDFGIAKAAHKASVTERGTLRGKLTYMSPEQTWGGSIDHRSDLFSLGVVLYEMLTGEKAFAARDRSDARLLELVRECRVTPPRRLRPALPEPVEAVVMRALARDPDERYPDAEAMQRDLDAIPAGSGAAAGQERLADFMEGLFTPAERGERDDGEATAPSRRLEARAQRPAAPEARTLIPSDPMTLERLLERFGEK